MNRSERWQRVRELAEQWGEYCKANPGADRGSVMAAWEPDAELRDEALDFLDALEEEEAERARCARKAAPPPEEIAGYRIVKELGRGGNATVYEARREREGRTETAALKLLHAWMDEAGRERFLRERQILSMLRHEGVAAVLDAGLTEAGQPFLVMELVEGQTLDVYCREKRLDARARIRLMAEVCEIVDAAHRKLVVHLDLKPSNIMVTTEGRIKVLDFGTAKLLDSTLQMTTTRPLTPVYASPEQLRAEPVWTGCDTYAAGLILYELLTGAWPQAGRSSLIALAERAAEEGSGRPMARAATAEAAADQGARLEHLRRFLSGDIEAVVEKALAPAGQRYASMQDLADDLRAFLEGRPVTAKRQTALYRARRFVARNGVAVAAVVTLACALAAVSGYAWREQQGRLRAAQRAQRAGDFAVSVLGGINPLYGGRPDMPAAELIDKALARLRGREVLGSGDDLGLRTHLAYQLFHTGKPAEGMAEMVELERIARRRKTPEDLFAVLSASLPLKVSVGDCETARRMGQEADALFPAVAREVGPALRASYRLNRAQILADCERRLEDAAGMVEKAGEDLAQVDLDGFPLGMPARVYVALVENGRSMILSLAKRTKAARAVAEEGLRKLEGEVDADGVRIALLRSIAQVEGLEGNSKAAAAVLEKAVAISAGVTSPFERLRLKLMWASRMAESGEGLRAAAVTDSVMVELPQYREQIGGQEFMLTIDAMRTYMFAGVCERVFPLARRVDALTRGNLPAAWRSTRLMAEGVCLLETGRRKEALPVLEETMRYAPPGPRSEAGRRLAKALEAARIH